MTVWIIGASGKGKTTIAGLIRLRVPNARILEGALLKKVPDPFDGHTIIVLRTGETVTRAPKPEDIVVHEDTPELRKAFAAFPNAYRFYDWRDAATVVDAALVALAP